MSTDLESTPLHMIPTPDQAHGASFVDIRKSAAGFYRDLMRVMPAGPHRDNARRQFRNCLVSVVLGVTLAGQVGPTRPKVSDDDGQ